MVVPTLQMRKLKQIKVKEHAQAMRLQSLCLYPQVLGSPSSGCLRGWLLGRTLFLACRWLSSDCVPTWWREREPWWLFLFP